MALSYDSKSGYVISKGDINVHGIFVAPITSVIELSAITLTSSKTKQIENARDFIRNAGFVSEREAVDMARDGNITGLPVTADDIRLAYRIYGPPPEFVKGRTVYKNISIDLQRHDLHTESKQSLIVDVIQVPNKLIDYIVNIHRARKRSY